MVECAYVASSLTPQPYFASQLRLGPAGIAGVRRAEGEGGGLCSVGRAGCTCGSCECPQLKPVAMRALRQVVSSAAAPFLNQHQLTRLPCTHPTPATTPAAEFLPLPRLTPLERDNYERMQEELRTSIQKGLDFAARQ